MSIRKRIYVSLVASVSATLLLSFLVLYYISSQILESRVKNTYQLVYNNYKEILSREERNLRVLDEDKPLYGIHHKYKIEGSSCEERAYYRVFSSGPYYGINKKYSDGCYYVGVNLEEVLKFATSLLGVDWLVYYERKYLEDILNTSLDTFMKDKVVIGDIVIDKFSDQKVILLPLNVSGYAIHGSFFDKKLLMEVPVVDAKGMHVGRVLLVKDVSGIYRETYNAFIALSIYSLLIVSFLSFMLLRIASVLANRIIFLKDVTASIEKRDFSVVELLNGSEDSWKDEVYELRHSIQNMALSLKSAFEELEQKKKELEQLAYYDPLTGMPNRRFFFDQTAILMENAKRYGMPLSLLVMDIDHFKKINDTYGHDAGDLVLKSFAEILRKSIRHADLPARFGGEEFVLLMPNTNLQQAKVVAERIRSNFQNSVVVYQGQEISTTVSGGLATYTPGVQSIDELIKMADEALYEAKRGGRNRIEVYKAKR